METLVEVVAVATTPLGGFRLVMMIDFVSVTPQRFEPYAVARKTTVPDAPAVKVIELPVAELVIVPLVMVQAYVGEGLAVTEAVFPVEFGETDDAAVIADIVKDAVHVTMFLGPPPVLG